MNSEILIDKEKLIKLLDHEKNNVRREAMGALSSFFEGTSGIIAPTIRAINKYKTDCLALVGGIRSFIPDDEEFAALIKLYTEADSQEDESSMNIAYNIERALIAFPFEILEKHEESLRFNETLSQIYGFALNKEILINKDPDRLWDSLKEVSDQLKEDELNREASHYAQLYCQGLQKHGEKTKQKVVAYFSNETNFDYYFGEYLFDLAGALKIDECVPYLFGIMEATDSTLMINDKCMFALKRIGGQQVFDYIEKHWKEHSDQRANYAEILKSIPYDYTEDFLIRSIEDEESEDVITFLCDALCRIFSIKGVRSVLKIIKEGRHNPEILSLGNHLEPVLIYHEVPYNQTEEESKETPAQAPVEPKKYKPTKKKPQKKRKKKVIPLKKKKKKKKK